MRDVAWSNNPLGDMDALAAHIASDSPAAALTVLDRINRPVDNLRHMLTGRRGRVAGTYEKKIRSLPYIIAYALQPLATGGERIVVLRVVHGAREWPEGEWPKS